MSVASTVILVSADPAVVESAAIRPLRVAVELTGHSGPDYWADLTLGRVGDPPLDLSADVSNVVRVRAADLREAGKLRDRIRAEAAEEGRDPDSVTVLVDVEIVLASDARTARTRPESTRGEAGTLSYVGTPHGLAGLIADIHAVQVADGVTLIPLAAPFTVEYLVDGTLPWLESRGLVEVSPTVVEVLRRFGEGARTSVRAS
ncbi:hypothetical protein M1C57_15700 [Rhodococcus pyridinivorans]|uniref:hypothetical protein n=1 Tax=Rhodococcus pyridinivorans TaxID=103816 RepID=UPI00200A7308|nr:hypothetical protein [Rhodococcus pyridinivorans]UPW03108.1 hypothetical protein M1C57_15700 [Rhodococcus pyridinivorans]